MREHPATMKFHTFVAVLDVAIYIFFSLIQEMDECQFCKITDSQD